MTAKERRIGPNNSILRHAKESTPRSLYGPAYITMSQGESPAIRMGKYYSRMQTQEQKDYESPFSHQGHIAILGNEELVQVFTTETGRIGYIHLSGEKSEVRVQDGIRRPVNFDVEQIEGYAGDGIGLQGEEVKVRQVFRGKKVIGKVVPMICPTSYQNAHTVWMQQNHEKRSPKYLLKAASRKLEKTETTFQAIQNLLIEKVEKSTHGANKVISDGLKSRKIIHNVAHLQEVMRLLQDYFEAGERAKPYIKKRLSQLFDISGEHGQNDTQRLLDEVLAL